MRFSIISDGLYKPSKGLLGRHDKCGRVMIKYIERGLVGFLVGWWGGIRQLLPLMCDQITAMRFILVLACSTEETHISLLHSDWTSFVAPIHLPSSQFYAKIETFPNFLGRKHLHP